MKPDVTPPTVDVVKIESPVVQAAVPVVTTPQVESNVKITETQDAEQPVQERRVYGKEVRVNGLRAIYGRRGETPLGYAYNAGVRYSKLLDINEIDERPLPVDMYLYLERKNTRGTRPTHVVKEGENLFLVAQEEGMVIKNLMDFNLLLPGDEPAVGEVLYLQEVADSKPALAAAKTTLPVKQTGKNKPVVAPYSNAAAIKTATANKPVRVSRMKVSYDMPPAPSDVAAGVPASTAKPTVTTVELPKEQPVQIKEQPVQVKAQPEPVVVHTEIKDPTQEEMNNGFPKVAEPRYASTTEPAATVAATPAATVSAATNATIQATATVPVPAPAAADLPLTDAPETASAKKVAEVPKEEVKPEQVKETILPTTESTTSIDAIPVKTKPSTVAMEAPKTVAVPVIEEEPKDELDKLKRKFDRVVYANEQKIATANPAPTPVVETPKAVATPEPAPKTVSANAKP